jgi:hypothetical protein
MSSVDAMPQGIEKWKTNKLTGALGIGISY